MRLQNIYDSIPDAIDRVIEEVLAKYEWVDVVNLYRVIQVLEAVPYGSCLSESEIQRIFDCSEGYSDDH